MSIDHVLAVLVFLACFPLLPVWVAIGGWLMERFDGWLDARNAAPSTALESVGLDTELKKT